MENVQNLLEDCPALPLPRVINGFRLVASYYAPLFGDFRVFWSITPNRSPHRFCFCSLSHAVDFAKRYKNCHTESFWSGVFVSVYSLQSVQNFL